jgi:hypothetical protein
MKTRRTTKKQTISLMAESKTARNPNYPTTSKKKRLRNPLWRSDHDKVLFISDYTLYLNDYRILSSRLAKSALTLNNQQQNFFLLIMPWVPGLLHSLLGLSSAALIFTLSLSML